MAGELLTEPVAAEPATKNDELLLIDLSSIVHPIWHMSQSDPNPDATSIAAVDRVRSLASPFPAAAICCDSGKSFRKEIDPTYKAQRPAQDAPLKHQMRLTADKLKADGFPVWCIDGFEADDVIASAVQQALAIDGTRVLIATADKDLLQLVGPRVLAKSVRDGALVDAEAVKAKFGVTPEQMGDYLCLVGDASDNVKGAKGIGEKRAAEILATFGTLDAVYAAMDAQECKLPAGILNSLVEFRDRLPNVRQMIALRSDVAVPFAEVAAERTPKSQEEPMAAADVMDVMPGLPVEEAKQPAPHASKEVNGNVQAPPVAPAAPSIAAETTALAPVEFERQLEPRSLPQAMALANHMHAARMFNGYGSPQGVLSTILAGRELGMQAVASLRGFHVIDGKHALAADAMRGLVLRSGQAKYFRVVERTHERATFETWRVGEPDPVRLSYSIEEGRAAFVGDDAKWNKSAWAKHTPDMLAARASSKLARLVYADILFGLYAPEELHD